MAITKNSIKIWLESTSGSKTDITEHVERITIDNEIVYVKDGMKSKIDNFILIFLALASIFVMGRYFYLAIFVYPDIGYGKFILMFWRPYVVLLGLIAVSYFIINDEYFDRILSILTLNMYASNRAVFYMRLFGKTWHDHL